MWFAAFVSLSTFDVCFLGKFVAYFYYISELSQSFHINDSPYAKKQPLD